MSLGATFTSASPDFGVQGVLDRFGQTQPKVLIACDGYFYNGKTFSNLEKLAELVPQLPSLVKTVVVPYVAQARGQSLNVAAIALARTAPSKAKVFAIAHTSKKSFIRELAIPSAIMAWNFSARTVSGG